MNLGGKDQQQQQFQILDKPDKAFFKQKEQKSWSLLRIFPSGGTFAKVKDNIFGQDGIIQNHLSWKVM
ncbi:MAG: hypothetical protein QNJ47_18700 [Nostocaceae cyanobacterium]|nr:hypothetical protein [Nostocaceae cyanobacterium]